MVTAVASYLDAKVAGGIWLVRMEDLDPPREVPGAADGILRTLEHFGLAWDGKVRFQSRESDRYRMALDDLLQGGRAFGCNCTRAQLADASVYPGTCRGRRMGRAYRLLAGEGSATWEDRAMGPQHFDIATEVGDFVLRRADGFWAYHLAVVVDDADQGVTDIVRGADLLDSTARHLILQRALGVASPTYMHLPLVFNDLGQKLSKQTLAPSIESWSVRDLYQAVFAHLDLSLEASDSPSDNLARATRAWAEQLSKT